MGLRDWRTKHSMKDPVRGEFRVTGDYHPPHQADSNFNVMLTGVVVADGVPPTPGEHMDHRMLGYTNRVLPVLVDRADPTRWVVLWDEVRPVDYQAKERERAQAEAQRLSAAQTGTAPADPSVVVVNDPKDLPPWLSKVVEDALHGDAGGVPVEVHLGDDVRGVPAAVPTGWREASGVLLAVTDVAVPAYALPGPTASLTDLTLQVQRPDGSSATVQTRMGFRSAERRSKLAVIGSTVPLRVDPADETHVSIDTAAWDHAHGGGS